MEGVRRAGRAQGGDCQIQQRAGEARNPPTQGAPRPNWRLAEEATAELHVCSDAAAQQGPPGGRATGEEAQEGRQPCNAHQFQWSVEGFRHARCFHSHCIDHSRTCARHRAARWLRCPRQQPGSRPHAAFGPDDRADRSYAPAAGYLSTFASAFPCACFGHPSDQGQEAEEPLERHCEGELPQALPLAAGLEAGGRRVEGVVLPLQVALPLRFRNHQAPREDYEAP
mmetsp:Transcript_17653/g.68528  ORF Transcript_17653/g.68528 Transcript_17653/m.68528 type:complete len:226 (-) Transcript_17653:621-1298(-)